MAMYPFILINRRDLGTDAVLLNHEKIHLRQQIELLVLPFYIWYLLEYVVRLWQYRNHRRAYLNISFEHETYFNERDLNYLRQRRFWKFRFYL